MNPLSLALSLALAAASSVPMATSAPAADAAESVYTKIDDEKGCVSIDTDEMGGTVSCAGHGGYGVLLSEGDLRQTVFFGYVGEWYSGPAWESFAAFNYTNDTVEWRARGSVPHATILRWFIENSNPDTGSPDEAHRGQVLVVSKVGQPGVGDACVVGYVDALANPGANDMAREIADTLVDDFACRTDTPEYHGARGPLAGEPSRGF
ncbi:MAG: hypothetical protein WAU86_21070, partial [Oricola sp.]